MENPKDSRRLGIAPTVKVERPRHGEIQVVGLQASEALGHSVSAGATEAQEPVIRPRPAWGLPCREYTGLPWYPVLYTTQKLHPECVPAALLLLSSPDHPV